MTRQLSLEKEMDKKIVQTNARRIRNKTFIHQGKKWHKLIVLIRTATTLEQTQLGAAKQTSRD